MRKQLSEKLENKLDNLPEKPGCYQMMDSKGKVIYVGKAVVLKNRVRSYFQSTARKDSKTRRLVKEICDISWWVTESELEALILENELIKRYHPRYNVRLKDDRQFPYIKVHWQDDFPKISVVRQITKDGARYFGPYASSKACYQTLDALRRIFPYLDCDRQITGQDERPCLYYHIKLCGGPCIGKQDRQAYRDTIENLMDFLHGKTDAVVAQMESSMEQAATRLQFEVAALYRDRLKAAQRIVEEQKIISASMEDADYIAVAHDARTADAVVQVFIVRNGRLIGRENYTLEGATFDDADSQTSQSTDLPPGTENGSLPSWMSAHHSGELILTFIQQFYDHAVFIPKLILVQELPTDGESSEDNLGELSSASNVEVLESWLSQKRGSAVQLRVPKRGPKRELLELAHRNASEYLRVQQAEWAADTNRQTQSIAELQEVLELNRPASRIECFDISTFQGTNTVGSMVVFAKGAPLKSAYRRFKIRGKGAHGSPDDFASMREMLRRRFRRVIEQDETVDPAMKGRKSDETWRVLPDLVIIDGGKGQLGVAVEVLQEFDLYGRIPVVGLAKREEEIFRPGEKRSTWLKRGSAALHLLQRIRDEAHRFAITYHRNLRTKEQTRSKLDDVPGIGPSRRKALLQHFGGDLDKIRRSTIEELLQVAGMTRSSAQSVKEHL